MSIVRRIARRGGRTLTRTGSTLRHGGLARSPLRLTEQPAFLVIGAQKAATSSFFRWLCLHPAVVPPRRKELHYFDERYSAEPLASYWADFPLRVRVRSTGLRVGGAAVTGEATPYYLFHPLVPARVHAVLPQVKLIVILRDPIDRAVSHYRMRCRKGGELLPLEAALDAESARLAPSLQRLAEGQDPDESHQTDSYVARGMYADQIERWLALFPRSQMFFIEFEALMRRPVELMRAVADFLGIPDPGRVPAVPERNRGSGEAIPTTVVERLRAEFHDANTRLYDLVGIDYNADPPVGRAMWGRGGVGPFELRS